MTLKDFERVANECIRLREENQKLKKKYENAVADYETTMAEKVELERQLEDMTLCRDIASGHREEVQNRETLLLTQQKEFIKYLEDEIKLFENDIQNFSKDYKAYFSLINDLRVSKAKIEEILQKYKEIIGDDKE